MKSGYHRTTHFTHVDPHSGEFLQLPSLPRGGTSGGHVSTHDWLTMNIRSGLEVQMKMGHVAWESGSRCMGIWKPLWRSVSGSWR